MTDTAALSVDIPTQISPADDPINDDAEIAAIVIDNGSRNIRVGYGGKDMPEFVFPSFVGKFTTEQREMIHSGYIKQMQLTQILSHDLLSLIDKYLPPIYFTGNEALNSKNKYHPIQHSIITNWDDIQQVWHHTFYNELKISPETRAVLMTETALNPKANREKMTQILFETFNVPSFYVACKNTLQLYASGRTTGMTLRCGYDTYNVVPIYEGYAENYAVMRQDIGGKHLTEYLYKLINEDSKSNAIPMETINDIKEKLCFVKQNKETHDSKKEIVKYKLPDGNSIDLDKSVLSKCCEAVFDPKLIGLDELGVSRTTFNSIMKVSVSYRKDLYGNIVLSGGTTLFDGFAARLQGEVKELAPDSMTIRIIASEEREFMPWIGGSILTSLSTFEEMWINKHEYDESGPSIVHRKCT